MQLNTVGIAGEMRCVVSNSDGSIKTDTGYQKNLILNQGLDFFGSDRGSYINQYCAIGAGNSEPLITQTKLDAYITQASGSNTTSDYSYVDDGSGLYKMWEQKQYRFEGLNNVNVSECGLVSTGISSTNYYLTTRVLIKDSLGNPTTITVLAGETLDIYYKIHKVIDVTDKNFVINVLDGDGGAVPYNVVVRPINVGKSGLIADSIRLNSVLDKFELSSNDLSEITTTPLRSEQMSIPLLSAYVDGSYRIVMTCNLPLNIGNAANIRIIFWKGWGFKMLPAQMRLGRVSDDAPLTKTNKETLTIPLEFSWGRYEGVL